MDTEVKKIIQDLKKVRLTIDEKFDMRQTLMKRINSGMAPKAMQRSPYISKTSMWTFLTHQTKFSSTLAFLFIFVLTGSTVALAAEKSLPGDPLYPIKIQVDENILRAFNKATLGDTVAFETNIMEKRLVEAEELAHAQKLNQSTEGIIQKGIISQESRVQQVIAQLAAKEGDSSGQGGAADANVTISTDVIATTTENSLHTDSAASTNTPKLQLPKIREVSGIGKRALNSDDSEKEKGDESGDAENAIIRINTLFQKHQNIIQRLGHDTENGEHDATSTGDEEHSDD